MRFPIDLELVKKHVHADDFTDDDAYLEFLRNAATDWVLGQIRRTADEVTEMGCGDVPNELVWAILAVTADMYDNRESTISGSLKGSPALMGVISRYTRLV